MRARGLGWMRWLVWCLAFWSAGSSFAQTDGNTTLVVTAKGSGVPISKAEVRVGKEVVFTDPKGVCKITVPAAGDGTVTVIREGFEHAEIQFKELRPPGSFDVRLIPAQPSDDNVIIVRGQKSTAVSRTEISIDEAAKVAPGGDPAQVVKLLPGVQSSNFGNQIIIQGSGPHDSRFFIDDLEVPFIFHSFDNLSVIPGELLSSVDFESAGFGTEYGDATGGIVTLRTKNDIPERPLTDVVFNVPFYSGIVHTRPIGEDESLTLGVRRSYIDIFLRDYLAEKNKHSKTPSGNLTVSPYFADAEAQFLKRDEDGGHTKLTLLGAYDGIKAVVPAGEATNENGQLSLGYETGFVEVGAERETHLNRDWRLLTTTELYYEKFSFDAGSLLGADSTQETFRIPTHFTKRLSKNESLYLGVDPQINVVRTDLTAPQPSGGDPTYDPEDAPIVQSTDIEKYATIAGWAAIDQELGPLIVTPGVRAFYNGQIKRASADPRVRARLALNDANTLLGAAGQYSESPQAIDASASRGNPHLDFIRADHYLLGVETKWNDLWYTKFDVYYKNIFDLVEGDPVTRESNAGKARSRGFETFIRRNPTGRLFGWVSYTYSKTDEQPSADAPWRNATYDEEHVLTVVGDYKLTGTWDIGGRYDFHTGEPYTLVNAAVFNANIDKYDERPTPADINAGRLPPQNELTVYFTHDFLYDTWKLAMRFGMEQYWFQPQVEQVAYNYNYTKQEKVTSLTSIPFFELKGEF